MITKRRIKWPGHENMAKMFQKRLLLVDFTQKPNIEVLWGEICIHAAMYTGNNQTSKVCMPLRFVHHATAIINGRKFTLNTHEIYLLSEVEK